MLVLFFWSNIWRKNSLERRGWAKMIVSDTHFTSRSYLKKAKYTAIIINFKIKHHEIDKYEQPVAMYMELTKTKQNIYRNIGYTY